MTLYRFMYVPALFLNLYMYEFEAAVMGTLLGILVTELFFPRLHE